jgi:hypothetical protein
MWKIAIAFVVFAAVALYVLSRSGGVDMGGEKHAIEHTEPAASAAPAAASGASAAGAAASAGASAAASK